MSDFKAKMHQSWIAADAAPWGNTALPYSCIYLRGLRLTEGGGRGVERKEEGKGRERGEKGRTGEGGREGGQGRRGL